jgi:hypothetical protein
VDQELITIGCAAPAMSGRCHLRAGMQLACRPCKNRDDFKKDCRIASTTCPLEARLSRRERTLNLVVKSTAHEGLVKQSLRAFAHLTGRFACDQNDR